MPGNPLKRLIVERGSSQSKLAKLTGVSVTQVNSWCNRSMPRVASLVKIADALGCSVDAILGRSLACVSTRELLDEVARRSAE